MTESNGKSSRCRAVTIAVALWVAAFALAVALDRPIAVWARSSGIEHWIKQHDLIQMSLKSPGVYYFTLAVAVVVALVHPLRWRAGGFVLLATVVSGANGVLKWCVGRTRPFKLNFFDAVGHVRAEPYVLSPFRGGWTGFANETNLSFPSGHAALAFATAAALAILWPRSKWRWVAFVIAAIVAAERVSENAHWLSDTVGAAALGVGGVYLIRWLLMQFLPPAVTGGDFRDPTA